MDIGNIMKEAWKTIWNKDMEYGYLKMDRNMMGIFMRTKFMGMEYIIVKKEISKEFGKIIY